MSLRETLIVSTAATATFFDKGKQLKRHRARHCGDMHAHMLLQVFGKTRYPVRCAFPFVSGAGGPSPRVSRCVGPERGINPTDVVARQGDDAAHGGEHRVLVTCKFSSTNLTVHTRTCPWQGVAKELVICSVESEQVTAFVLQEKR